MQSHLIEIYRQNSVEENRSDPPDEGLADGHDHLYKATQEKVREEERRGEKG